MFALKVLDEVERRRALSPALVQPFMRAIMEAQFPAPGKTITIKTFLPGSGTEVNFPASMIEIKDDYYCILPSKVIPFVTTMLDFIQADRW